MVPCIEKSKGPNSTLRSYFTVFAVAISFTRSSTLAFYYSDLEWPMFVSVSILMPSRLYLFVVDNNGMAQVLTIVARARRIDLFVNYNSADAHIYGVA